MINLIQRIKQFMGKCPSCKGLALCQTEQLAKIVGVLVVIEIIGYIFGIGFLIWLFVVLTLWLIIKHWEDR